MKNKIMVFFICFLLFIPLINSLGNAYVEIELNDDKSNNLYTVQQPVIISIGKYSINGFQIVIENNWGSTLYNLDIGYEITGGWVFRGDKWNENIGKLDKNRPYIIPVCFWPPNQTAPISPMGFGRIEINAFVEIPNFDIVTESREALLIYIFVFF